MDVYSLANLNVCHVFLCGSIGGGINNNTNDVTQMDASNPPNNGKSRNTGANWKAFAERRAKAMAWFQPFRESIARYEGLRSHGEAEVNGDGGDPPIICDHIHVQWVLDVAKEATAVATAAAAVGMSSTGPRNGIGRGISGRGKIGRWGFSSSSK